MPISPAPLTANPSIICDWIEISVLRSMRAKFRWAQLHRSFDVRRDTENSDSEGESIEEENTDAQGIRGEDGDRFLEAITDEIGDRIEALPDAYPFVFSDDGLSLELRKDISQSAYIYLFCLFISNCKKGEIMLGTWLPPVDHQVRDLFQACATLAAAGYVNGSAVSFGWPRPDENLPFLEALRHVYGLIGEGTVVTEPKPGSSPAPKDQEIDVIAWRPQLDNSPGTFYLLGQVASGDNWDMKSINGGPINSFHKTWFTDPPASPSVASIFVPHVIQPVKNGNRKQVLSQLVPHYGIVFDRFRVPYNASLGIRLAALRLKNNVVERTNDIDRVVAWVDAQHLALKAA
jgi:hypothetical protein